MKKLFLILVTLLLAGMIAAPIQAQESSSSTQVAINALTQTGTQAAASATEAASTTSSQAVPLDSATLSVISTANAAQLTEVAVIGPRIADFYGFSPDSHTLAYDDLKGDAHFWDIAAGKSVMTIAGVDTDFSPSRLSGDGKTLVVVENQGTAISTWDTATGKSLSMATLEDAPTIPAGGVLSSDGKLFASELLDMTNPQNYSIGLWDATTGKQLHKIKLPVSLGADIVFSPDSKTLAAIYNGVPSHLIDTTTGKILASFQPKGRFSNLAVASFSPDGKTLLCLLDDGSAQSFDLKGKALTSFKAGIKGWAGVGPIFSPDGKLVVLPGSQVGTGPVTRVVGIADSTTGKVIVTLKDFPSVEVNRAGFSPDGKLIAFYDNDNQVLRLWGVAGVK